MSESLIRKIWRWKVGKRCPGCGRKWFRLGAHRCKVIPLKDRIAAARPGAIIECTREEMKAHIAAKIPGTEAGR